MLIHDPRKDINPKNGVVKGDLAGNIVILTEEDIMSTKPHYHLRGYSINILLIPKKFLFGKEGSVLKKSLIWQELAPCLYNGSHKGKIIYY